MKKNQFGGIRIDEGKDSGGRTTRIRIECNHKWKRIHEYKSVSCFFRIPTQIYVLQCEYCGEIKKR